ncbi:unnamed protein product [Acanthoscelides obtectus]|uniref:Congested-like trachea protein n=1 Tax=Acanthoscelides obtectus TaxID=200917 RepID=A0A9P0NYU7_ACAOB|nr:unnamed protein product [Acanthoscelides obtectus]CAK1628742.1 Congested-like trachea protein [Acanthoscelides obtectus]
MGEMGPGEYFICGGFGGICTVLVGHPLDTIKVRLQTMPITKKGEQPLYTGTLDCFKKTIRNEGFRGLYKGMGAPLVGVAPIFAISFMGYGVGKQIFGPANGSQLSYIEYFTAGAFSGIFTTLIMAPGERIKCLLQIQHGINAPKVYDGPVDCLKKLYRQGGIQSIYRGSAATMLRAPEGTYKNGIRDVFTQLMKNEGASALYKGITPVLIRAFPANAACFVGFELCKQFLDWLFPRHKLVEVSNRT